MSGKKTIYLHIGTDKTGSTAIQGFMYRNRAEFERRGLAFVNTARHGSHHGPLCVALKANNAKASLDGIRQEIDASPFSKHLLTYEGFCYLHGEALANLTQGLRGYDIRPILYLRRRSDKFRSGFAQRMKWGKPGDPDRQLLRSQFVASNWWWDYARLVENWCSALDAQGSSGALVLKLYERSAFQGGDLLTDFLSALDVLQPGEVAGAEVFQQLGADPNPSIGPASQYLMALLRSVGVDKAGQRRYMERLLALNGEVDRKDSVVPDDFVGELDSRFSANDRALARRYFQRDELFLDPPQFVYAKPTWDRMEALLRAVFDESALQRLTDWDGTKADLDNLCADGRCHVISGRTDLVWHQTLVLKARPNWRTARLKRVRVSFLDDVGVVRVSTPRLPSATEARGYVELALQDCLTEDGGQLEIQCHSRRGRHGIVKSLEVLHPRAAVSGRGNGATSADGRIATRQARPEPRQPSRAPDA